ncbi:MAG TPA: TadE family protein [Terriglobales bacterium]|nr:TadE family protein [Terriglobales bacterium]
MNRAIQSRIRRDERGQAIVEFALVIGFLVILVVSILEMSLFLYNYAVLTDAAKDGARCAVVHCSKGVTSTVDGLLAASVHGTSGRTLNVSYLDDSSQAPGSRVQVTVSYSYAPLFLTNWASIPISATSVGRIQF